MTRNENYKRNKDVLKAHKASWANEILLKISVKCGCFSCGEIYDPAEIVEWVEDRDGLTAICPYCGIDSVLPDCAGYPITKEFLERMNKKWFGGSLDVIGQD